jgi:hypothetical protein
VLSVGSLFSGIGGFDLGLERAGGFRTDWFCEQDEFCRAVLAKHWPGVPRFVDIQRIGRGRDFEPRPVDVLCGGFPCQDISVAGTGAGLAGARSGLWSDYARLIGELGPSYVVVENVSALLARGLGPFSQTWPRSGMTRNGTAFQLQPLAPLTAVTGSGLLPTPDTGASLNGNGRRGVSSNPKHQSGRNLDAMARFGTWPDAEHRTKDGLWTTPAADDTGHRKARYAQGGSALSMQAGGRLNPEWIEWLMGFPIKWSDCTLLVTRSSRRSRSGSAGASSSTKPKENSVQPDADPTKPKQKPDA